MLGALLNRACEAGGMQPELVARLAGVDTTRFLDVLRGSDGAELSAADLDRCARVFGLRLDDLLNGEAGSAPLTLLMRSSPGPSGGQSMLAAEVHNALGEFLRVVRDIADLERILSRIPAPLPTPPVLPPRPREHPGETLARSVRDHLGLGIEPIRSLRTIVEQRLGVVVVWVTQDQVDRSLDGACTIDRRPAVLVNLIEPEVYPWRTRITLAHELCHVLFDEENPRALVSPYGDLRLFPGFEEIEQRARAFAACFLAPTEGVKTTVKNEDPTSEQAIRAVGETFGVGRLVAINRLGHVYRLSAEERRSMTMRAGEPYQADFAGDSVEDPIGMRGGVLLGLVGEALRRRAIGAQRARRMLGLKATEPLPFLDLDEDVRRPLVTRAEIARRKADQLLAERWPDRDLMAAAAEPLDDGFRILVTTNGIGQKTPPRAGHFVLSATGEIVEEDIAPV